MAFKLISSDEFEFIVKADEIRWYRWSGDRWGLWIVESLAGVLGVTSVMAPVRSLEFKTANPKILLPLLGMGVGFDATQTAQCSIDGKRVSQRGTVLGIVLLLLLVLLFGPMTYLLSSAPGYAALLFVLPALFLLFYLALGVVLKLSSLFL